LRLRPLSAAVALTATAALVLTGCGGGSGSGKSGGGGKAASAVTNEINPVDRTKLKNGGDLRWALGQIPANYNYNQLDGTLLDNAQVVNALLPAPFDFKPDASPVLNKDFFTKIEVTKKDPQTVTYDINAKAKWSDGKPVSADDLIAQWKALNGTNKAYNISSSTGYDQIATVAQGSSATQAVVTFKNPYADWQALFAPLYPASTNNDPNVFNTGWINKPLQTAGPFIFQSVDKTAQTITLARNPQWWGDKPVLDRIIYRAIDLDAQIDALANGEIDFIDVGPNVNNMKRAEGIADVQIRRAGGPNFRHITFNGTSPILSDVNVRQAIAKAIDRQTIADAMVGPLGGDSKKLDNHIFMRNQTGYQDNAGDLSTPDVKAANDQLQKAGWTRTGDTGTRTKAGKPLEIRFVIPSGVATSAQESQLVQGMLAKIGVKVTIQTVPTDGFFDKYVTPGNFDLTVFSWIGTQFPISSSSSIYANPKGDEIQQNYARVGSPEIDKLFDDATHELDPAKARDLANQADKLIWDEVHSITLYQRPDIVAAKKTLANYGALGFASVKYQDIGFTK
jgi:peptide/nickel transport system substrate-binding protein